MLMATDSERVLQNATNFSLQTVYKNTWIKMRMWESVKTFEHALEIGDTHFSSNPESDDSATHSSLALSKLCAAMREIAKEDLETLKANRMQALIT